MANNYCERDRAAKMKARVARIDENMNLSKHPVF